MNSIAVLSDATHQRLRIVWICLLWALRLGEKGESATLCSIHYPGTRKNRMVGQLLSIAT
jgi:hypothetical protein